MTCKHLLSEARTALHNCGNPQTALSKKNFFKNCPADIFLGVKAASVSQIAKQFLSLELADIQELFHSSIHEERSLAHALLCRKYRKGSAAQKEEIFSFYIQHRHAIRDWDGVDDSAPYIVGPHLLNRDKQLLYQLAASPILWDRRIAIVATWWFIRHGLLSETFTLATLLLQDREDLIHKAVGWMLREAGKRDLTLLRTFLDQHAPTMPRTMLRYAIEKLSPDERKSYLSKKLTVLT